VGARASYTFKGTQARVYIWRFEEAQAFDVFVDGQLQETAVIAPGEEGSVLAWESDGLSSGSHTIEIEYDDSEIHLDAFEYNR